jgi:hypothetical protein
MKSQYKKYEVGVQEVYTTWITVEAKCVSDAKLYAEQEVTESGEELEKEFSHTIDSDNWTVVDEDGNYH